MNDGRRHGGRPPRSSDRRRDDSAPVGDRRVDIRPSPPPALLIAVRFEAKRPRMVVVANSPDDRRRFYDFLYAQPDLLALVEHAFELAYEEAA